jgi:hypothetical protein
MFDASQRAQIATRERDDVEVKTQCPGCGEIYYQFTLSHSWTSERQAIALLNKARELSPSDKTESELLAALNDDRCPDCGNHGFLAGPEGGLCQNIKCKSCGSEFNYCPPCAVATTGIAERIGSRGGGQ